MPDDVFRVVITVAVALACIAFVVQAAVVIAFYRAMRKMQDRVEVMGGRMESLAGKVEPVLERVGPVIDKTIPLVERAAPMMQSVTETVERVKPVIDRTVEILGKVGAAADPILDGARQTVNSTNQIIADSRPHIAAFSEEAVGAARAAREQVERIGDLLHNATDRAQARLEQIDQSLEHTVGQVGQVGDAMKRAVMRPVREANGVAAGITAAVSTLVHPRKSPNGATQDEEMFI